MDLVKDRMSSPVITTTPATPTREALEMMAARKIRRLPVVLDRGNIVGIVTQRDLYEKGRNGGLVGSFMTPSLYTTGPDVPLVQPARVMRETGIGALPVIDHGRLVGIITESDIFDAFLDLLGGTPRRHPVHRPGARHRKGGHAAVAGARHHKDPR